MDYFGVCKLKSWLCGGFDRRSDADRISDGGLWKVDEELEASTITVFGKNFLRCEDFEKL